MRGDGRNYIFDARVANMRVMAGSYQHKFDTKDGEWTTIRLPFADFKFHYFGRLMENVDAMEARMIDSLGVTLADYNPGAFELEIRDIRGYVEGDVYDDRLSKLSDQLGLTGHSDRVEEAPSDTSGVYAGRLERLSSKLEDRAYTLVDAPHASRVMEVCALAIDRGVPLFNHGQHAACASVYEVALVSIVHLGGDELGEHARMMIWDKVEEGRHMNARDRAWYYRRVLDELMRGHVNRFMS